jgi:phosphatidylglycerophosphate synthase
MDKSPYVRVQKSFLAAKEHLLLIVMAKSLPTWIEPDHLTMFGLCGSLLCCIGFTASGLSPVWLWLVVIGLVANWAGDSLDGNLARVRGAERPVYGFFLDHTSDILSQALIFMGLAASPYVLFATGCLLLMSYWIATMFTFIRTISLHVFQISYFGIGPTEIRLGLMVYVVSLLTVGPLPIMTRMGVVSLMDMLAMAIFPIVMLSFIVMTLLEVRRLGLQDGPATVPKPDTNTLPPEIGLSMSSKTVL